MTDFDDRTSVYTWKVDYFRLTTVSNMGTLNVVNHFYQLLWTWFLLSGSDQIWSPEANLPVR